MQKTYGKRKETRKNIAIITYSKAYNYGSALQAYALNFFLSNLGCNVKTIDYTTERQQALYKIFEPYKGILSVLRNLQSILCYSKLCKHKHKFDEFVNNEIPQTEKVSSVQQFVEMNEKYDYFICGSDQIWNVQCDDFDTNYMLSFVKDKNKCIAYAPSLGAGADYPQTMDMIRQYTNAFKAISSRETKSTAIIEKAINKNVQSVLDPVFLLSAEEWNNVSASPIVDGDYILGYFIGDVVGMRNFAANVHRKWNMPVVVIYKNLRDVKYNFSTHYEAGPADFVTLVKNARCVITNSFHAVSFSLIFKVDFWAFVNKSTSDSRIKGLLNDVGLSNRIIDANTSSCVDAKTPIQYESLDMKTFKNKILQSKKFLTDNIF